MESRQTLVTHALPPHLASWTLPPGWEWGAEGVWGDHRHYQEVIDALGRSLSLVSVPNPEHATWLAAEARHLAHRSHPSIPTTYHYWAPFPESKRGPGYLRRWIAGETVGAQLTRTGAEDVPFAMQLLRATGSVLAYLHSGGTTHGALSSRTIWMNPMGRHWLLGWEWAMSRSDMPVGLAPSRLEMPIPPEWRDGSWVPTPSSDQWQLAATAFAALTGEYPPDEVPPISLLRPECPQGVCNVLDRALSADPAARFPNISAMLRTLERSAGARSSLYISNTQNVAVPKDSEEARLRWALGDDYDVLARLGAGTFGSVWRVRDLTLEREVALKMLHPQVARDDKAVRRFRREAQLAASLAHPAIVPIYDWDSNAGVSWYTMELAEGGSLADLLKRSGPRPLNDVAPQIEHVLDGLAAAHASGIIHRDLKPENILIDRYRRWRIADFGVAKVGGEDQFGTTGTPEFSAPEQLLGEAQGPPVDCFEVAAITAFVLTGEPPFGTGDGRTILGRMLSSDVDLSAYPPEIEEWMRRGLAPNPENRFSNAAEMQDAWRSAVETVLARDAHTPWWRRWLPGAEGAASGI
ncbi:MAG: serine/threonine-protein kinase [Gemmatimonadaceae bacterium]